jgi:hypothetical protein
MATESPPVPGGALGNAVKPPNEPGVAGARVNNGFLPLAREAGTVQPANRGSGGDRRDGSFPLGATSGGITPPNHRFDVGMSKMPQPPSALEPGKGVVPVNPFLGTMPVSEMRKGK